jgi:hypothetical protein
MHDPRLYAIMLLAHNSPNVQEGNSNHSTEEGVLSPYCQYDWKDGEETYNEWVAALGADAVKSATASLVAAPRDSSGNVQYATGQSESRWMSPYDCLTSTLIGSDIKKRLRVSLAHDLQLTTSAALNNQYNQLVAKYGEPAVIAAENLVIDKGGSMGGYGSVYHNDYDKLQAVLDQKVKLDAAGNVDRTVANPSYISWKQFPIGTLLSSEECRWEKDFRLGMQYPYRSTTEKLFSIDDSKAQLVGQSQIYRQRPAVDYRAHAQETVQARMPPEGSLDILREGDEMVPVGDQTFRCHWITIPQGRAADGSTGTMTTWKCSQIPGGLARIYQTCDDQLDSSLKHFFLWAAISCDHPPASVPAPDASGPLTASGQLANVPPFPQDAVPTVVSDSTPPDKAAAPLATSLPRPIAPPVTVAPQPLPTAAAVAVAKSPSFFWPSAAPKNSSTPGSPKTILGVLKEFSHFAGMAPQSGSVSWQLQAELDWDDTNQQVTGWIYFPQLKGKKQWQGKIVEESGRSVLQMTETAFIGLAPGSNVAMGITYLLYPVGSGFQGTWATPGYHGRIFLSPMAR